MPNDVSMERTQAISIVRLHDVLLERRDDVSRGRNRDVQQHVSTTSQTSLRWNNQRRLSGTSPRRLSGAYPRRPISTSLQRLLWVPDETPSNVKSMWYVSTTSQSNVSRDLVSRSLLRFQVTLSWNPSGRSHLSIKSNTKFF